MNHKRLTPGRVIALGFAGVIFLGTILLLLPISANPGVDVNIVDALFTSTSAVCVTGLIAIDTANTFNVFGRTIVALLIQVGGLGVTSIGVTFILMARKNVNLKERAMVKEALNLDSLQGIVRLVKSVIITTICFEFAGMVFSFIAFSKEYPPLKALGISAFHAIAAFNNSGFDILGNFQSLIYHENDVLLNLTTCALIIFGGLGFVAIKEIIHKRRFQKFSLNTKVVILMTVFLLVLGTLALKLTDDVSWLGAFFMSTSARTAGFTTYNLSNFSNAGLFLLIILMFIGASPGSTGGGIKTTTAFTIYKSIISIASNRNCSAFKRKIPNESIFKAFIIIILALALVIFGTLLICIIEPQYTFMQILFEVVSAFGTVGLSTGITPELTPLSKFILCLTMFSGRVGPLTMASIWSYQPVSNVSYPAERITIG